MGHKKQLLILILLGLATHFLFFGHPNQTVFDEVHFGKYVSGYYTHEYYFDIHPPLGKLLIAGFGKLFNFSAEGGSAYGGSFAEIGDKFPDSKYMALRFLPSLAGSLIPAVIFLLALQFGFSRKAAFTAGILIALENGLLVQTRFMLMDGFLLLFGFLSLLFYFKSRRSLLAIRYWLLAAVFAGLAASIKWTGLTFLAVIMIVEAIKMWRGKKFSLITSAVAKLLIIPFAVYFSVFALHFALLDKPGPGDAYMSQEFHEKNVLKRFVELNMEMYRSNQRLTSDHPYSSKWYSWPFMTRPIFYWVDGDSRIYFLGNPAVWWASTVGAVLSIWYLVLSPKSPVGLGPLLGIKNRRKDKILILLLGAYALNLLPFIGIQRVMFLYHYMIALVFAVLMLVYVVEKIYNERQAKIILTGLVLVSIASFFYFAPLTYGLKLSPAEYEKRVLFPSWK